jgi:DNA polymerase-3 subunit alpha
MNVVLTVEATMESEQLKLLARAIQPIDSAVADAGAMGIKVFVDQQSAIASVAALLQRAQADAKGRVKGEVTFCLMDPDLPGEVEILLGDDFPVNPQIKGAIKSLGGVLTVEDI